MGFCMVGFLFYSNRQGHRVVRLAFVWGETVTFRDDIGVISGRYHSVEAKPESDSDEKTVLEIFAEANPENLFAYWFLGLRPSFEITPLSAWNEELGISDFVLQRVKEVEAMKDVVEVSGPTMKLTDLGTRPIWTVTVRQPFVVPNLRKMLSKQSWQIYSGDIPFVNRLFLDHDLRMHISVEGEVVDRRGDSDENLERTYAVLQAGGSGRYSVDVTVACNVSQLKDCEPFQVPFQVFSFDLEPVLNMKPYYVRQHGLKTWGPVRAQSYSFKGEESSIMENLTLVVRGMDPDIITGYNIDNFDLPRLFDRMQFQTKSKEWRKKAQLFGWGRVEQSESESKRNRSGLFPRRQSTRAWNVAGRSVVDAWWQARMALRPQRETLSFITNLLFPEDEEKHKMDVDASKMDKEWAERPEEVMEYCIRDAELPLDILNALQVIRRKEAVAAVAKVAFDTAAIGSTSQLVDSLVIRLADSENVAVPLTGSAEAKEGQITGGYVHEVDAGLHPWIAVL